MPSQNQDDDYTQAAGCLLFAPAALVGPRGPIVDQCDERLDVHVVLGESERLHRGAEVRLGSLPGDPLPSWHPDDANPRLGMHVELQDVLVDLVVRSVAHDLNRDLVVGTPEVVLEAIAGSRMRHTNVMSKTSITQQWDERVLEIGAVRERP